MQEVPDLVAQHAAGIVSTIKATPNPIEGTCPGKLGHASCRTVRRAWRVTLLVKVQWPGFRRAEGKEKGKGVVSRRGLKEAKSETASFWSGSIITTYSSSLESINRPLLIANGLDCGLAGAVGDHIRRSEPLDDASAGGHLRPADGCRFTRVRPFAVCREQARFKCPARRPQSRRSSFEPRTGRHFSTWRVVRVVCAAVRILVLRDNATRPALASVPFGATRVLQSRR